MAIIHPKFMDTVNSSSFNMVAKYVLSYYKKDFVTDCVCSKTVYLRS